MDWAAGTTREAVKASPGARGLNEPVASRTVVHEPHMSPSFLSLLQYKHESYYGEDDMAWEEDMMSVRLLRTP